MTVKFFAYLRDDTRTKETSVEKADTVDDLLRKLCDIFGPKLHRRFFQQGELSREIIILVNGRHIEHLNGVMTPLDPHDEISIFPTVAGG